MMHLLSTVQNKVISFISTHWDHHFPSVQKMASEEVKDWGPLERVKPGFQVASPEAMPLAKAVVRSTGSRQAFRPEVGVLICDGFPPFSGNKKGPELHEVHIHSPWHFRFVF